MKKNRILIINRKQFGYHIDTYYYCKFIKDKYDITYLCWDMELKKITEDGVNVIYIPKMGNLLKRLITFIKTSIFFTKEFNSINDLVFIKYFQFCFLIPLLGERQNIILDIRTGATEGSSLKRFLNDILLRLEVPFFRHLSVISQSLADRLKVKYKNPTIIPLGAENLSNTNNATGFLNLLYVGTLTNRNIHLAVEGFGRYITKNSSSTIKKFNIIGDGKTEYVEQINGSIKKNNLQKYVNLLGYIPHSELTQYYSNATVGVSFIPKTKYFDCQPPTKTYEFLLAGIAVLATSTSENIKVVNDSNGVLIEDTAESFCEGLKKISQIKFDSEIIKSESIKFTWQMIAKNNLLPFLSGVTNSLNKQEIKNK